MNQHFLLRGFRFSLLLHGIVLCSIIYLGNLLPDVSPPLKIDFSIDKGCNDCPSEINSEKLPAPVAEKVIPRPPIKQIPPEIKPQLEEKKTEVIKPKEPEPKPVKTEITPPVLKKIIPLQAKKLMVVEKKVRVTAVEPIIKSTPVKSQQMEVEPKDTEPQETSALLPAIKPAFQGKSASPKEQYIKANFSFIRDTVERNINYPDIARRMGWEGKVLVTFLVYTDGHVENIRVIRSCGFKALDKNAIKTIKRCAPFPKPPLRAEVTLPITYRLN
jgi:protein TonB